MDDARLISESQGGDTNAFAELVRRYQNRCLATAISQTRDIDISKDVVQESFVIAWRNIGKLNDPAAFRAWLRTIVYRRCLQHRRQRTAPFEDVHLADSSVEEKVQRNEERQLLLDAIAALPEHQREMVMLHYFDGASHREVAEFMGLSKTRVNNQLHAARQHLKGRLFEMAKDTFENEKFDEQSAIRIADVTAVHGSLVAARADDLGILDTIGTDGATMVVVRREEDGTLLCVSTDEVTKEDTFVVRESNDAFQNIAEAQIEDAVRNMSGERDNVVLETGIKVVDIFAPIARSGSAGIFGGSGVGRMVFANEMIARQSEFAGHVNLFFYVGYFDLLGTQEMVAAESLFSKDKYANVSTAWIAHPKAGDPSYAATASYLDTQLYFSPALAVRGVWPAIDPVRSGSVLLREEVVGKRHVELVTRAQKLLNQAEQLLEQQAFFEQLALGARAAAVNAREEAWSYALKTLGENERRALVRAELIFQYLKQPFFCAEDFTGRPGMTQPLSQSLDDLEKILAGDFDDVDPKKIVWGEIA